MIGIAPSGGRIPPAWRAIILDAISRGMDVVSGLHEFIADDPEFAAAAKKSGAKITDVRKNDEHDVAHRKDIREECLRIHTVGQDCSVGKMLVAVELTNALKAEGHDAKFIATGQTGIMVEGDGVPIDRVVADFVNGAIEKQVLANQHHEILVVEGQGSISPSQVLGRHAGAAPRLRPARHDHVLRGRPHARARHGVRAAEAAGRADRRVRNDGQPRSARRRSSASRSTAAG